VDQRPVRGGSACKRGEHSYAAHPPSTIASNPGLIDSAYDETPAKFALLSELLPAYLQDPSNKVIVWTSFVANIPASQRRFSQFRPVTLYGEMDAESRRRAIALFKTDSTIRVLVANPAAAREGLS